MARVFDHACRLGAEHPLWRHLSDQAVPGSGSRPEIRRCAAQREWSESGIGYPSAEGLWTRIQYSPIVVLMATFWPTECLICLACDLFDP
jgi:hypothetical protein